VPVAGGKFRKEHLRREEKRRAWLSKGRFFSGERNAIFKGGGLIVDPSLKLPSPLRDTADVRFFPLGIQSFHFYKFKSVSLKFEHSRSGGRDRFTDSPMI